MVEELLLGRVDPGIKTSGGQSDPGGRRRARRAAPVKPRLDSLGTRIEISMRPVRGIDRALGGGAVRVRVERPDEFPEVQAERRVQVRLARAATPPG